MRTSVESARGCGFRKPGGLYLVSGELSEPCPLLPVEMKVCPTCGEGVRPARGFTWVDGAKLIPPSIHGTIEHTAVCPLAPEGHRDAEGWVPSEDAEGNHVSRVGRCGLIWIGEQFYPTPQAFMSEAAEMGVSRRITAVPREFVIGETWVLLGHRRAIERACPDCGDEAISEDECPVCGDERIVHVPGIITAFRPTAVEYVVKGDETDEEIEALERRGIEPVRVVRADAQEELEI